MFNEQYTSVDFTADMEKVEQLLWSTRLRNHLIDTDRNYCTDTKSKLEQIQVLFDSLANEVTKAK